VGLPKLLTRAQTSYPPPAPLSHYPSAVKRTIFQPYDFLLANDTKCDTLKGFAKGKARKGKG